MSEARRLLKKSMGYLPSDASVFHQIRAYLAQPMTKCEEREGELVAIKGRLLEIVEECEEIGEDPSYLFSMLDIIDSKILGSITEVLK